MGSSCAGAAASDPCKAKAGSRQGFQQRRAYSESTRPDGRGRSRGHRRENRATTTTPEEEGDMMTMIIMIKKHLFISFIYKFKAEPVLHFLLLFPEAVGFCSMRGTGSGSFLPILRLANTCPPGKRPAVRGLLASVPARRGTVLGPVPGKNRGA